MNIHPLLRVYPNVHDDYRILSFVYQECFGDGFTEGDVHDDYRILSFVYQEMHVWIETGTYFGFLLSLNNIFPKPICKHNRKRNQTGNNANA